MAMHRCAAKKKFRCWFALVFAVIAASFFSATAAPNYFTRTWQVEQGLPQNSVTAVTQSHDGYLWVGTYFGLARFDGVRFVTYNSANTPALTDSRITSLFEDNQGILWIGHETGELTCLTTNAFESVPVKANWARTKIVDIGADTSGDVWLLNQDGLMARVRDGLVLSLEEGSEPGILQMARSANGTIWVDRNGRVSTLRDGKLVPLVFESGWTNTTVGGIGVARDGGVWMQVDQDLREWNNGRWIKHTGFDPLGGLSMRLLEARNGTLLGENSARGFILVSSNGTTLNFRRANGFSSDWVVTACEDREGNYWVGTGGAGLAMIRATCLKPVAPPPPDGWQGRAELSMLADHEGALWVGTEGAGVYRYQNGEWTNFAATSGLSNPYVWSLAEDSTGNVWAGTWGSGLYLWRNGQFIRAPGLENMSTVITAMSAASEGGLWIGTANELLRYCQPHVLFRTGQENKDISPKLGVRCIMESQAGDVWFGTAGDGLYHLQKGILQHFRKADGLPGNFVQCLHGDDGSGIWIGTTDGLCRFKDNRFSAITEQQGLPDNVICDIEDDGRGFFWISSFNGIFCVRKNELQACADSRLALVDCHTFGISDGLPTLQASSGGTQTKDGKLLFATTRGLVEVDPATVQVNHLPPPVYLESLWVDGRSVPISSIVPLKIPPGHHRFEFESTGLSFVAPEKVRFKYRLVGMDPDWIPAGTTRVAKYNYLPPGDYVFRVTACNNDGVWNQTSASLKFEVLPYFWQTTWFRVLGGLATVLVAGSVVWFDTRRRMRRRLELAERQRDIERERSRIARDIHDDLGASLTRIAMLSQSDRGEMQLPESMTKNLELIFTTARKLTRAMDEIVWAVNPRHDRLDSLASYLSRFAYEYLSVAEIRCRLNIPLHLPTLPVTAEVRHNLFLAFKEALHNIVKHAAAKEVGVELKLEAAQLAIQVADDGRGFDAATPANGPAAAGRIAGGEGLANMRRRLAEIGGACEVRSEPGRGTTVTFTVPLRGI